MSTAQFGLNRGHQLRIKGAHLGYEIKPIYCLNLKILIVLQKFCEGVMVRKSVCPALKKKSVGVNFVKRYFVNYRFKFRDKPRSVLF